MGPLGSGGDQGAELGGSRNGLVGAAGQPWAGVLGGGLGQGGRPPSGWGLRSCEFTGRWAQPAVAEAEMKTTFLFVTENVIILTTGPTQAGGIQAFKSDRFA